MLFIELSWKNRFKYRKRNRDYNNKDNEGHIFVKIQNEGKETGFKKKTIFKNLHNIDFENNIYYNGKCKHVRKIWL